MPNPGNYENCFPAHGGEPLTPDRLMAVFHTVIGVIPKLSGGPAVMTFNMDNTTGEMIVIWKYTTRIYYNPKVGRIYWKSGSPDASRAIGNAIADLQKKWACGEFGFDDNLDQLGSEIDATYGPDGSKVGGTAEELPTEIEAELDRPGYIY